jgi:transposase
MAKGYRPVDRDQVFLFPPDMREWLPGDHPVWVVIEALGRMDTSAFHAGRRTGGAGAAGYDPDMLLAVLVWGYAHGESSSRRMEGLCATDVAFRVICAGNLPDHSTIARFRKESGEAVPGFFAEVLVLCARLGMGRLGVVALDGTKIAASASKAANRGEEKLRELAERAVAAHAAADAAEDELYGEGRRGDELPPEEKTGAGGWSPRRRGERIAEALAQLKAEREAEQAERDAKAAEFRARQQAGQRTGPAPAGAEVALAEENLARVRAARAAQLAELERRRAAGAPGRRQAGADDYCRVRQAAAKVERARQREAQRQAAAKAGPGPVRNITDPDSRLMPARGGGFIQGYNAQNVTSEDGLVIATRLTSDTTDMAWFAPMTEQAQHAAALIGAHRPPGSPDGGGIALVLADAGYCSEENLTCDGPDRLIAAGKRRDLEAAARGDAGPGQDRGGPAVQAMRERLRTEDGIAAYRHRGHIAETPHGHIKHNMRFRQLSVRGKDRAEAEWTFACAIHNLFKALTAGYLTPQALAALAG